MAYVRITLMRAIAGHESEVNELNREQAEYYRRQAGCLQSTAIRAADGSVRTGRVSFCKSEAAADAAASTDRSMSLRSRLQQIVGRDHQDLSFLSD